MGKYDGMTEEEVKDIRQKEAEQKKNDIQLMGGLISSIAEGAVKEMEEIIVRAAEAKDIFEKYLARKKAETKTSNAAQSFRSWLTDLISVSGVESFTLSEVSMKYFVEDLASGDTAEGLRLLTSAGSVKKLLSDVCWYLRKEPVKDSQKIWIKKENTPNGDILYTVVGIGEEEPEDFKTAAAE